MTAICRLCGGHSLLLIADLGLWPIAHHLRRPDSGDEPRFPFRLHACEACGLLQIAEPIAPEILYAETETYSTGFQKPPHVPDLVATLSAHADPGSVIEIGCNDGYFMEVLRERGYGPIFGIEPNRPVAVLARQKGFEIYDEFADAKRCTELVAQHGRFGLVVARHVVEHVVDLAAFFSCVRTLIAPDGLFLLELPQVEAGLDRGNPSILWEEHVNYFTEPVIATMLERFGFVALERRLYAFGGGTVAFVCRPLEALSKSHKTVPATDTGYYTTFAESLSRYSQGLAACVEAFKHAGYKIAIYGAAPRSCSVLNACGLGMKLDAVIDDRQAIQGLIMPATRSAIAPLNTIQPDGRKWLMLLGVGSENEGRVSAKAKTHLGRETTFVSLFPPRDTLSSLGTAMRKLKSHD